MDMMKNKYKIRIAVDLLWVRVNKVGGIESYIRNLLDGFKSLEQDFKLVLIVSQDNEYSFKNYSKDKRFELIVCSVKSKNVAIRILWQNIFLGRVLKKNNINTCFEPYYCKPFLGCDRISFITTIHDLQALHYPQYFKKLKVIWLKSVWKNVLKKSKKVIAISEYVKEDIIKNYNVDSKKIKVIYNPIVIDKNNIEQKHTIEKKYGVKENEFYFTVSSLLPHKNLKTIISVMWKIKNQNIDLPCKLIISGVGGQSKKELDEMICSMELNDNVILTDFITNNERNSLYKYCRIFLFPSIFEGFGMPPIEALTFDKKVITTKMTSIPEVTCNKAVYVNDAMNSDEWIKKMMDNNKPDGIFDYSIYKKENIALKYYDVFRMISSDGE